MNVALHMTIWDRSHAYDSSANRVELRLNYGEITLDPDLAAYVDENTQTFGRINGDFESIYSNLFLSFEQRSLRLSSTL